MDINNSYGSEFDYPAVYVIKVHGKLDPACSCGLEEMSASHQELDDGSVNTFLTGLLADQAALNGVLNAIGKLQLPILSVVRVREQQYL